jgi:hypothetical protein
MHLSALDRKLLRDLWHMRGQVLTVGLIVASGIATYVTMRGTYESMERAQQEYYSRYRFADVFAQLKRASIVTWQGSDVLRIPASAAFREQEGWSVFVINGDRARRRQVKMGHSNQVEAEVLNGLRDGEQVILHPPNQLRDGVRVQAE